MKAVIFTHVLYLILIQTFMAKGVEAKCESKVELRAVLLSCPAKESGCEDDDPLSQAMKSEELQILQADSRNFESLKEEKERGFPSAVKDCKRKLVITLKVKNVGKIPCDDEYIVVDHVFDPVTGGRGRLLSPVVVKLRQEQMVHLYGLQFQRVVNSDPFEEQKAGDKTCSVDPENPTCGIAMYDGKPIPFSEGFCCSCDPHVNAKRQLSPVSRGDSLLYRDSKLISQGNTRFVREEKPGAIVNPKLVQLKSGNTDEMNGDKKTSDCGGISDPQCWNKIPNYLMEHDRKIVCDNGDFMKELCRLRKDMEGDRGGDYPTTGGLQLPGISPNPGSDDSGFTTEATDEDPAAGDPSGDDTANDDVTALENFAKALSADRTANSVSSSEGHGPTKGSRGKRENRREMRKLTLEEKLDQFASEKKHLANRRKRLLELSHRRFRKVDLRCKGGPQSQTMTVKACTPDLYERSPPPRYFFSHDKTIIDPLEAVDVMMNTTCRSLSDAEYDYASKGKTYRLRGKGETFKNFDEGKEENLADRAYFHRLPKTENKMMRKEKYLSGKVGINKEKGPETGAGEDEDARVQEFKGMPKEAVSRGDKRLNPFKASVKNEEENESVAEQETKEDGREKESKTQFSAKGLKSFLRKGDSEKKQFKPKIRNFFMARNREKQKLRSELVKGYKKTELKNKENYGGEKRKENLKDKEDKFEIHEAQEKNEGEKEKESSKMTEVSESPEKPEQFQFSTERFDLNQNMFLLDKEGAGGQEIHGGERKFSKELAEKKDSRLHHSKEMEGDINFNVEIIRNQNPGVSKHKHHPPMFADQFLKNRMEVYGTAPKAALAYGFGGKPQFVKNKQNSIMHYSPAHNYYILENGRVYPQDAIMLRNDNGRFIEIKSRPRVDSASLDPGKWKTRMQSNYNGYSRRNQKQNRRFHLPLGEGESDPRRGWLTPAANRGDGRGKRHSESARKRHDACRRSDPGEGSRPSRPEKIRSKRSVSYSFQPALGFYESEFDPRKPNDRIVHELETCLTEEKTRKRGLDGRPGKIAAFHLSRSKHDNTSADGFSGSPELRNRFVHAAVASREPAKRERGGKCATDEQRLYRSYLSAPDYVLKEVESALKGKRQTNEPNRQENSREGATCDKDAFGGEYSQDTAHCMRFGDLWYGMYTIRKPVIAQIVGVQLFDKHPLCDGTSQWRDLTKGRMIRIGTFFSKAEDDLPTMSFTFMGEKAKKVESAIDPDNYYLLIPSHVSDPSKLNSYPQFEGGPAEYLLVRSKDTSSGGECNMIGTSFEAFARQPDRCAQRRGSCLKRQPVDLWREDMEARIRGKRGKYFVENFGNIPNSPIKTYTNLTGEFLALEYYGEYTSTIEIEMKADSNAIIRKGSNAQIPLVYIDSTYPKKTRIILSVLNIGLTSSNFRPRLGDCPPDMDPAWCPLEGPLVIIPPQQRHDFKLDLSGALPSSQLYLTVQVLNQVNRQIALRKIIIKRGDRCVCAFHCKCNCIGNLIGGKTCHQLSLEEYRKAGYIGSFPFRGGAAASAPESILGNIHVIFLTASYFLLFLGLLKGLLGVFFRRMGIAGTRIITGPRELCGYYEYELQECSVLYDECGFAVHPTTCNPVQIVPLWMEFIINLFFFFLYPLRGIWFLIWSLPCCRALFSEFEVYCRQDEGDSDHKCSRPLLSKQQQPTPTCVHYNLTTVDTKKAKQEYLPYTAYKGDDDPLEEDDTEFVLQEMKRYRKK